MYYTAPEAAKRVLQRLHSAKDLTLPSPVVCHFATQLLTHWAETSSKLLHGARGSVIKRYVAELCPAERSRILSYAAAAYRAHLERERQLDLIEHELELEVAEQRLDALRMAQLERRIRALPV